MEKRNSGFGLCSQFGHQLGEFRKYKIYKGKSGRVPKNEMRHQEPTPDHVKLDFS